jgi:ParB/RepB/Spo0J family partition protein
MEVVLVNPPAAPSPREIRGEGGHVETLRLDQIRPSRTNPRGAIAAASLTELVASIRQHGVLQPLLVRTAPAPNKGIPFELVAGHRRYAAAREAGLKLIPANIRSLSDQEVLEIQLVENLQREDLDVLEEADGYRRLVKEHRLTIDQVGERVGKSKAYVYARLKLAALTKPAAELLRAGRITAGHAILLARLKPGEQALAIKAGLFEHERLRYGTTSSRKAISVRQLEDWITNHARFDAGAVDAELHPATAAALTQAREKAEKIVAITNDHFVQESARTKDRVFGPASWKRITGKRCAHAATGVIVVGPGRGEAFPVCVEKKKCAVHWPQERRAAKRRASATGGESVLRRRASDDKKWKEKMERDKADRLCWEKARARLLPEVHKRIGVLLPARGTAMDLVRALLLESLRSKSDRWEASRTFPPIAKRLGVDVRKALAPLAVQTSAPKKPGRVKPRKPARPRKRK